MQNPEAMTSNLKPTALFQNPNKIQDFNLEKLINI